MVRPKNAVNELALSENQEQRRVIAWCNAMARMGHKELGLVFHVPNEGRRSAGGTWNLVMLGLKKGVPDLFFPVARRGYHGMAIEMKAKHGRPTKEQVWWIAALKEQHYAAHVCHGAEEAIERLTWYFLGAKIANEEKQE